jgi:hypothetical protein
MSATRRVCLFGTSANPPTGEGGHAGIVQHLADLTWKSVCSSANSSGGDDQQEIVQTFDEVRVLPVYKHMFQVSSTLRGFLSLNRLVTQPSSHKDCHIPLLPTPLLIAMNSSNIFRKRGEIKLLTKIASLCANWHFHMYQM